MNELKPESQILARGVDSLYVFLGDGLNFAGLLAAVEKVDFEQEISLQGLTFTRCRAYMRTYAVSLRSGFFTFFVNRVSVYVQVASLAFEMRGFDGVLWELCGILDKLNNGERRRWLDILKVSRIDVYVDFVFDGDFNQAQFLTKLRCWGVMASDQDGRSKTYYFGSRGKRGFIVRLYTKSYEILQSGKTYLTAAWKERGAKENSIIWRLEFEYRVQKLDFLGARCLTNFDREYLENLFAWGIDQISYMASESKSGNLSKKKLHPVWEALRAALYREYSLQPAEVKKANLEFRFKLARRYALSYCAAKWESFQEIPETLRREFALGREDFERARRAVDLWELE